MLKKIIIVATMLCALPVLANAWTLSTRVKSQGGSMQSPNSSNQIVTDGLISDSYTTTLPLTVTVTPDPGMSISLLELNGLIQTLADPTAVYTTTVSGPSNQSVYATFAQTNYTLSAVAGANGSVSPTTSYTNVHNGLQSPAKTFIFTPASGYNVQGITFPYHVLDTDYQLFDAATSASVTLPAATGVRVKVNIVNVNRSATLTSSFSTIGANAGPNQTVLAGGPVILDGSASNGATTYAWTQVSGPVTVSLSGANTSQATFIAPSTTGNYKFTLTINGGSSSSTTTVFVTDSIAMGARGQCENCHSTVGVGAGIFANWSSSVHKTNAVVCYKCHVGANTGGHPGTPILDSSTVNDKTFNYVSTGTNFCITCHDPSIPADFAASVHVAPAGAASCSFCHANVHYVNAACVNCHTPGNPYGLPWPPTGLAFHNDYTGTNLCVNCHKLHNPGIVMNVPYPHFSTFSTAQFVTTNILCNNCHHSLVTNSFNIYSANYQWAKSGKANPKSPAYIGPGPYTEANLEAFDFKFLGTPLPAKPATTPAQDCVRCHTTTGFINYITPTNLSDPDTAFANIKSWGTPGDRTREMIACPACHNNTTGFDATFSRRSIGIETDPLYNAGVYNVAAWYGYSSAATHKIIRAKAYENPAGTGMFDSNLCIACHAGKVAGDLIKLSGNCTLLPSIACRVGETGSFWTNVDFIDPHNMNAANVMFPEGMRAGYEYRSGISASPFHTNIGIETSQGPCVGCHMSSPNKHSFLAISTASNGTIAAITTNLCATCHGINALLPISATTLQTNKDGYQAALTVIAAQLTAKGIYYNSAKFPYFFTTADPAQQAFATRTVNWNVSGTFQGANLMGAAFNLRLLQPGAGWVHNSLYSKRLLYDTIDYLYNGRQNNNVTTAINTVVGVDSTVKTKAHNYIDVRP